MQQTEVYTQLHWAWALLLVPFALGMAWWLYQQQKAFNGWRKWTLASLRACLLLLLVFLILQPVIRYNRSVTDPPRVVLAVDNSRSIALGAPEQAKALTGRLATLTKILEADGISVEVRQLGGKSGLDSLQFNTERSDLAGFIKGIQQDYENRHLNGLVLVSDGLYNQGSAPDVISTSLPVHAIGVGDTIQKQDLAIKGLQYNKISYLGNKFTVRVNVANYGFKGSSSRLVIRQGAQEVASKVVSFSQSEGLADLEFILPANQPGQQHYVVELAALKGEFTTVNNIGNLYIEVIDGRERVLIMASAPHPDIKAIRSALESLGNLEVQVWIPALGTIPGINELKPGKPDLVIAHQLPDVGGNAIAQLTRWSDQGVPFWFITGAATNFAQLNQLQPAINMAPVPGQTDKVSGSLQNGFNRFSLAEGTGELLPKLPPLDVPFGNTSLANNAEVVLNQSLGKVVVGKPLLAFTTGSGKKNAVLAGLGLWQWRLQNYAEKGDHVIVDQLVQRVAQYLSAKDDKRKLRVAPVNTELFEQDRVVLQAELYNDLFEPVYNQPIELTLQRAGGATQKLTITPTETNNKFGLGTLAAGVYNYTALASLNGKQEKVSGQFTVQAIQLEATNTTADFGLLRSLANKTHGRFVRLAETDQLATLIKASQPKGQIRTFEDLSDAINLRWLLFLMVILAVAEWFLRKFWGSY